MDKNYIRNLREQIQDRVKKGLVIGGMVAGSVLGTGCNNAQKSEPFNCMKDV